MIGKDTTTAWDQKTSRRLKNSRVGLVLAGGGAKRACSMGCLRVFKDAGIEFNAISGTSVEGLNAALWSSNRIDEGEKLWRSLKPKRVYKLSFFGFLKLPENVFLFKA